VDAGSLTNGLMRKWMQANLMALALVFQLLLFLASDQ
jgi:hypothetical protein